jgi:hypothetical protein
MKENTCLRKAGKTVIARARFGKETILKIKDAGVTRHFY